MSKVEYSSFKDHFIIKEMNHMDNNEKNFDEALGENTVGDKIESEKSCREEMLPNMSDIIINKSKDTITLQVEHSKEIISVESKKNAVTKYKKPKKNNRKIFACTECDFTTHKIRIFNLHQHVHAPERPHACDVCGKTFRKIGIMNRHKLTHEGIKPFLCDYCGKSFAQAISLKYHKLSHINITNKKEEVFNSASNVGSSKKFLCDHCGKCFSQAVSLKTHKKTHINEESSQIKNGSLKKRNRTMFKCSECPYTSNWSRDVRVHIRTHTGEKPFPCDVCGKFFTKQSVVKRHKLIHGDKNTITTKKAVSKDSDLQNTKTISQVEGVDESKTNSLNKSSSKKDVKISDTPTLNSKGCPDHLNNEDSSEFLSQNNEADDDLRPRVLKIGPPDTKKIKPNIDKAPKISKAPRIRKRYYCDDCPYLTVSSRDFKVHRRRHTGEKPYSCPVCGKKFANLSVVRRHQLVHTGVKSYFCDICHKGFSQACNLKSHKLRHFDDATESFVLVNKRGRKKDPYRNVLANVDDDLKINHHPAENSVSQIKIELKDDDDKLGNSENNLLIANGILRNQKVDILAECSEPCIKIELNDDPLDTQNKLENSKHLLATIKINNENEVNETEYDDCLDRSSVKSECSATKMKLEIKDDMFNENENDNLSNNDDCFDRTSVKSNRSIKSEFQLEIITDKSKRKHRRGVMKSSYEHRKLKKKRKHLYMSDKTNKILRNNKSSDGSLKLNSEINEESNLFIQSTEKNMFSCNQCHYSVPYKRDLIRHIRTHSGERPYSCPICDRRFTESSAAKRHLAIHSGEKRFACNVCGKLFSQSNGLKIHMSKHNDDSPTLPFICDVCGKCFLSENSLKKHSHMHLRIKSSAQYSCHICGKAFPFKCRLKDHLLNHAGEKKFACDVCSKLFLRLKDLKYHRTLHEQKSCICETCGKAFSTKKTLRLHYRTHSGERPYSCEICGMSFAFSGHRLRHKLTHSGIKAFACEVCDKSFAQASALKRHSVVHVENKPFRCEICGRYFKLEVLMKRHTSRKHSNKSILRNILSSSAQQNFFDNQLTHQK